MKLLLTILAIVILGTQTQAQRRLKITKEKMETYNTYTRTWGGWPTSYTYFQSGSEPILEVTNLDDQGVKFSIGYWINGSHASFTVTYDGYDSANNWYKYIDENGDQVCILGSTLSYLAQNGWPSNLVQIYLWIDSENYALVFE